AAGTTAGDASGHGFVGTIANATWTTAGKFGGALSFNGANSWVTVADNALFHLTTGMTLEAWVKPNALDGWTNIIMKERPAGLAYALYASDNTDNPPAGYINRSTDVSSVGTSALSLGAWTHLATTYDGANLRLYVNGTLVRTQAVTGAITSSTSPIRIGGDSVWGEYFDGLIDEIRVYGRALSQSEVQADMNTAVNAPVIPPSEGASAPIVMAVSKSKPAAKAPAKQVKVVSKPGASVPKPRPAIKPQPKAVFSVASALRPRGLSHSLRDWLA
ncbi:MAG TPA: LamG-like jellyroll fold domain-containing protein, partial [Tepidisphaeraceae bacterium]